MNFSKKETFNCGIALLKSLMCFIVILCHFWTIEEQSFLFVFNWMKPMAVPTFMFVSFYLTQNSFLHKNKEYFKKRVGKLVLPHVVWACIYFIFYWLGDVITHSNHLNGFSDLLWQIFTGHSPQLNATMWFQVNLLIFSLVFFVIFYFFNERVGIFIICLLCIACFFLQYSELNYRFFKVMRYELCYPLGRLAETFPMAALGFISSRYNLLMIKKNNKKTKNLSVFILALIFLKLNQSNIPIENFGYAGFWKMAFAFAITMFAYNLNFNWAGTKLKQIISLITKYTLGIYCAHKLVGSIGYSLLTSCGFPTYKFHQCIIIYIVSFFICWILSIIPCKWIKNIV